MLFLHHKTVWRKIPIKKGVAEERSGEESLMRREQKLIPALHYNGIRNANTIVKTTTLHLKMASLCCTDHLLRCIAWNGMDGPTSCPCIIKHICNSMADLSLIGLYIAQLEWLELAPAPHLNKGHLFGSNSSRNQFSNELPAWRLTAADLGSSRGPDCSDSPMAIHEVGLPRAMTGHYQPLPHSVCYR